MDAPRLMSIILDCFDVTNVEFARELQIDQSYITHILKGKRVPPAWLLHEVAKKIGVPFDLLLMAGEPAEMNKTLGDGSDPRLESLVLKQFGVSHKKAIRFVVAMRADLLRSKK